MTIYYQNPAGIVNASFIYAPMNTSSLLFQQTFTVNFVKVKSKLNLEKKILSITLSLSSLEHPHQMEQVIQVIFKVLIL